MGVPKFFRYMSERYPCLSEVVKEYQIPEFDNLYLDMNGIIHMCSHPDDNNPHFRISEEKIFQDVFHYIEVLFRMIRPQKLFFMAVDGVAPRAKMNQQRGRRFRSARDAIQQEKQAQKKGEKLPDAARFDSNCITPGTEFMDKLHQQLKYFVVEKISCDPLWRKCKVILSGHETPGEGEHKIMDYIRYMRAQPGYDPNTRHCLYGLDADLIMLGLCTHEPHFSLLREEVKFGKKSNSKRTAVPEEITFYLLHLSLMREYLELEFTPLKDKLQGFQYDFEKIIDDWVLMGFLVGNDFIPHLPNLHITDGALPILYKAYMEVLPTLDGYINESGTLNLARFEKFMQKLGEMDLSHFEEVRDDLMYMESKTGRKWNTHTKVSSGIRDLEKWEASEDSQIPFECLEPEASQKLKDSGLEALIKETDDLCVESSEESDYSDEEDEAFINFKKDYYRNKMEYTNVTREVLRDQAEGYVRAIQWNLNYYYNGVCSWSWYYPHHYAPYVSDIKGFSNLKIDFELGKPFKPFEQLLAVLPAASKNLLPKPYHRLMVDEDSPIKHYYPEDFQTDLNGKKQEWEAVVLIPFLDEKRLLEAMEACNRELTPEEIERNTQGPMLVYSYTSEDLGEYPAPEYFARIKHNHAKVHGLYCEDIRVPQDKLIKGAYPGVKMDVYYPGFPTMKHLNYKAELQKAKIKVFDHPSRNETMIISIIVDEKFLSSTIPTDLLDTCVYVSWPHLVEAKVAAISNKDCKYISMGRGQYDILERSEKPNMPSFKAEGEGIIDRYKNRLGIEVGETKVLVHAKIIIGRRYVFTPNGRLSLEKQFADNEAVFPLQAVIRNIKVYDTHHTVYRDVLEVFPEGSTCFTLTNPYYGSQGTVLNSKDTVKNGRIKISVSVTEEPDFSALRELEANIIRRYKTLSNASSQLGMSNYLFSRITGSIFVVANDGEGGLKNVSIGLDLKFNKKNKETPGYTRKIAGTWYYTDRAVEVVREYADKYPEVFECLKAGDKNDDISAEKLFGEDWDEKLKELQKWLRSLPVHSVERKTCGGSAVDKEVIEELEKIVDSVKNVPAVKIVTMQIKPNFLYKPDIQDGTLEPDPKMHAKLFDRVVNVREGFSVPFGLKGTIVAINEMAGGSDRDTMYDIVFDAPFKDGLALNCSPGRGYRLPKTAFINISYGKRLMEEKTGKPAELIARAEAQRIHPLHKVNMGMAPYQSHNNPFPHNMQKNLPNPLQPFSPQIAQRPQFEMPLFNVPPNQQYRGNTAGQNPFNIYPNMHRSHNQQFPMFSNRQQNYNSNYQDYQQHSPSKRGPLPNSAFAQFSNNAAQRIHPTSVSPDKKPVIGSSVNSIMPHWKTSKSNVPPERSTEPEKKEKNEMVLEQKTEHNKAEKKIDSQKEIQNITQLPRDKPRSGGKEQSQYIHNNQQKQLENKNQQRAPQRENKFIDTNTTDFLKKLLNIGDDQSQKIALSKKEPKRSDNDGASASQSKTCDRSDKTNSAVSFKMFEQVAKATPSVRLLTYYQSNGLGMPRYQYFNNGNDIFSQITLPNGDFITGKPAKSREEASENVAEDALTRLLKKAHPISSTESGSEPLPEPPTSWMETQKENETPQNKSPVRVKPEPMVISNDMVPLQALKHINKCNSSSRSTKKSGKNVQKLTDTSVTEKVLKPENNKNEDHIEKMESNNACAVAPSQKPKKEKKRRIAAKFSVAK